MPAPDAATLILHDGLAVHVFGAGEPLLLMPGPHRLQRPGLRTADVLIFGLTRLGRRVVTFDPPGSGRSTRAARMTMAEMLVCAEEALAAAGVERPVDVLGHSMGGLAALALAIERPSVVRRLVLVGTGTGGRAYLQAPGALWNRSHPRFWRMAALGMLASTVPRRGPERLLMNFVERESFVDRDLARPRPVAWRDLFRPREGRTDWHRTARTLDYRPKLRRIAVPVLVACGRRDPQYPPVCSIELASGIADAELAWFGRSGHYPFIEEPEAFWRCVELFLRRTQPAPPSYPVLRVLEPIGGPA